MSEAIEVQRLREFEGGPIGWYAKGHHDPGAFILALAIHMESIDHRERVEYHTSHVRHEYWRNLPAPDGSGGSIFVPARGPGPGAYRVTVVE